MSDALARNKDGFTALMWAASSGEAPCIQKLLPLSDALAIDKRGRTALMRAASYGHVSCVGLLLPMSEPAMMDHDGKTASELATENGNPEVASLIDAYTLAISEMASLGLATGPGIHRPKALPRL